MGSKRALLAGTALLALLAAVFSLCAGAVTVPPGELLAALTGQGEGTSAAIILYVRLPRTAGCLAAGASLAVSGAVIQTVLANPLASPNVIGVNAGAGAAVALCCALPPMAVGLTPIAAFAGAFGSALLVLAVSQRAGASRMTLILTGVALSSIFSAAVDLVVTLVPDAPDALTSNAGWDTIENRGFLTRICESFRSRGIRTSIFIDPDPRMAEGAAKCGADRVELYTAAYAAGYAGNREKAIEPYLRTAEKVRELGLGLNAGHDLSLENLHYFVSTIPWTDEVSIGHALICEALYMGLETTITKYLEALIV